MLFFFCDVCDFITLDSFQLYPADVMKERKSDILTAYLWVALPGNSAQSQSEDTQVNWSHNHTKITNNLGKGQLLERSYWSEWQKNKRKQRGGILDELYTCIILSKH